MGEAKRKNSGSVAADDGAKKRKTDDPSTPKQTYIDLLQDTICLYSNDHHELLTVHKGLLRQQSPCLARKIIKEGHSLMLDVPLKFLKMFVVWLYNGCLIHPSKAVDATLASAAHQVTRWDDKDLAELYCFANSYKIRDLKNDAVTAIIHQTEKDNVFASDGAVRIVFEKAGPKRGLSNYFVQQRARHGMHPALIPKDLEHWPSTFLAALLRAVADKEAKWEQGIRLPMIRAQDACTYHDHTGNAGQKSACQRKLLALYS